jgi:hypothetical protein
MSERSRERITDADLARLCELACADLAELFQRRPETGRLYRHRLLGIALCQGAALHYIDGRNGIKDFDVWSFFAEHPERPFPYRRNVPCDFGPSKFGRFSDDPARFLGRRVDMLGRSLPVPPETDPVWAIREYLHASRTKTARLLAEKAAVMLWPEQIRGVVAWPPRRGS